ncbi:hypothetical protein ACRE_085610 [Hapsidospora chrysogenum ATCC 11550]|uniref:Vacuolar ATPase assembly protein VMA22 n=1 Tax=Hapsidospora chrysogenum (strain ATCC 11550 / CBS 779.69 / DSM 880 / IAM 14645 / JCM 23072 / IMI 49137) TaxID=857340 RepID=A0A086SUG0_HAPC1|nr:hypothetical protein ACRE_085610 [Hapsidospora chrysogenum ATCC 11550]
MDQDHIDSLLERYLALLDEYTRLRDRLSRLQSGVHQNIARANFSAERGLRYGQDQYDGRMRASRVLDIRVEQQQGTGVPSFGVVDATTTARTPDDGDVDSGSEEEEEAEAEEGRKDDSGEEEKEKDESVTKPVDPLRWFGLLAPMPLRNAQGLSAEAVEQVIPRLVTVDAEMRNLEIEVRRARKKRSKAAQQQNKAGAAAAADSVSAGEQVSHTTTQVEAS